MRLLKAHLFLVIPKNGGGRFAPLASPFTTATGLKCQLIHIYSKLIGHVTFLLGLFRYAYGHRLFLRFFQTMKVVEISDRLQVDIHFAISSYMRIACFIVQPFYKISAQKGQSKQHCMCIKEKQNNSSQSFLRNPSTLKLPLAHV